MDFDAVDLRKDWESRRRRKSNLSLAIGREEATLDKLFKKIDPAYLFAEIPTRWVSRKHNYHSVLIHDVTVYDVRDVGGTKKALRMETE